jgi:hypothetical protein
MGAAFIGRDTWRYSVVAVIAGAALLFLGALASRRYLGAVISRRGVLRRRDGASSTEPAPERPNRRARA